MLLLLASVALAGCSTPPPVGHTAAELQEFVDLQNMSRWTAMFPTSTEQPPAVTIERFINEDESDVPWHCMADAGVAVEFDDGMVSWTSVPEGIDATNLIQYTCMAKFPTYPPQVGYLTDGQRDYLYDYYRSVLIPCLAMEGYPLTGDAPSRSEFVDVTGVDSFWTPYSFIAYPNAADEREALAAKCPSTPFRAPVAD